MNEVEQSILTTGLTTETRSRRVRRVAAAQLRSALTPDQREAQLAQSRASDSARREIITPEQAEAHRAQRRAISTARREILTPEQLEAHRAYRRERASLRSRGQTPEANDQSRPINVLPIGRQLFTSSPDMRHNLGRMDQICSKCQAKFWLDERICTVG